VKKRINFIIAILMFLLFINVALATDVTTNYSGKGDFNLQTNIQSEVTPFIDDSATIHTGCNGGCCCCPNCDGSYNGFQFVTNNPFSISVDEANVNNGCVALQQNIHDNFDNHTADTNYYTYLDGSGTATSYIYATPGQGSSYQLANGTGSAFVSFGQSVFLNDNFDYETTYGGGTLICIPGYVGMVNEYDFYNGSSYYNSQLGLYCYPADGSLYAFLFAKTTDLFSLNKNVTIDSVKSRENIEAEGSSDYKTFVNSTDNFLFGFKMELS
jgi:hypothetical protein